MIFICIWFNKFTLKQEVIDVETLNKIECSNIISPDIIMKGRHNTLHF